MNPNFYTSSRAQGALEAFRFKDAASGRQRWVARLDRRAVEEEAARCGMVLLPEEADARCSHLRRGRCWGSQEFAEQMLKVARRAPGRNRSRNYRSSPERKSHDANAAEVMLMEGLGAAGLDEEEIQRLPGSERRKVAVARAIWERTTVPQNWLAARLAMGSAANVSQQLRRSDLKAQISELPRPLRKWLLSVNK